MTVLPDSQMAHTLTNLLNNIAASATYQAAVGEASEAAALPHIHVGAESADNADRPLALLSWGASASQFRYASGAVNHFLPSNDLMLLLIQDVAEANQDNFKDAYLAFLNFLKISEEMLDFSGVAGYSAIESINLTLGPLRSDKQEKPADYFFAWFNIHVEL